MGLGRIGLPFAVACRRAGHAVVGVDVDDDLLRSVAGGDLPYDEPGLDPTGLELAGSVASVEADVFVISVGTNSAGRLDPAAVLDVGRELPAGSLVLVESTVPPGTCEALADDGPSLVAHCPERARPGAVLGDVAEVARLIGGVTPEATRRAVAFYSTITDARLIECTAREAELAKLAENAEREVRIAFANELADAATDLGVDPARVIELANSHPRIDLLRPGVGVGGHCLPMATDFFARGSDGVAAAARVLHERRPRDLARRVASLLPPDGIVCVLGRTYRPNTSYELRRDGSDPYGSPALEFIDELRELEVNLRTYDPADPGNLDAALDRADLVIVAVAHQEFQQLETEAPVVRLAF